jgi:hypothetical protein
MNLSSLSECDMNPIGVIMEAIKSRENIHFKKREYLPDMSSNKIRINNDLSIMSHQKRFSSPTARWVSPRVVNSNLFESTFISQKFSIQPELNGEWGSKMTTSFK